MDFKNLMILKEKGLNINKVIISLRKYNLSLLENHHNFLLKDSLSLLEYLREELNIIKLPILDSGSQKAYFICENGEQNIISVEYFVYDDEENIEEIFYDFNTLKVEYKIPSKNYVQKRYYILDENNERYNINPLEKEYDSIINSTFISVVNNKVTICDSYSNAEDIVFNSYALNRIFVGGSFSTFINEIINDMDTNKKDIAEKCDIKYKTFIDKLDKDTFTAKEFISLSKALNLNDEQLQIIMNKTSKSIKEYDEEMLFISDLVAIGLTYGFAPNWELKVRNIKTKDFTLDKDIFEKISLDIKNGYHKNKINNIKWTIILK